MRERDELRKRNAIGKHDEIPMWKRDNYRKAIQNGKYGEIPMWKRDKLWKCTLIGKYGEIPMWKRDYCGNTIKPKSMMKFQWGKETILEMQ